MVNGLTLKVCGLTSVNDAVQHIRTSVPILSGLTDLQLREFLLDSEIHRPADGEVIFKKNDYTNSFYAIVEGEVVIETETQDGKMVAFQLGKGEFFGEMGLIDGSVDILIGTHANPPSARIRNPHVRELRLQAHRGRFPLRHS